MNSSLVTTETIVKAPVENINEIYLELETKINNELKILTWSKLYISLPKKTNLFSKCKKNSKSLIQPKQLISNVDGMAKPGEILAIMGASGAGKTTLLNALNFRNRGSLKINGEIKVNGNLVKTLQDISSISGYVQQDDLFIGYLTVKEHLMFQAMLRMEKGTSKENRMKRVDEVIHDLNLKKCENTIIGVFGIKGISGGEKRRLGFASEIITNPSILFCDEPTSGLDSFMASSISDSMRNLAKMGKTIICTIHQPSSEIFESFDKLCLLAEGRLAYFGDLPGASEFFKSQGYILPTNYNPADFYIKKLAVIPSERESCLQNVNKICDGFHSSENKRNLEKEIKSVDSKFGNEHDKNLSGNENKLKKSNIFQLKWLLWRNILGIIREPFTFKVQIIQTLIVALLFGLIYLRLNYDQKGVMDMNGFLYLCICNNGFSTMFFVVNVFPIELPIFYRDHENGMYRVISYYLAKILTDLPNFFILPIVFMSIVYWMANLNNDAERFFICVGVIILVVQCSLAFGTFISAASPSTNVALALSGPVLVPLMIFSGFLLNNDSIPKYFIWLKYMSWFGYANELITVNQWRGVQNITCPSNTTYCFTRGEQIIEYYRIDPVIFNFILKLKNQNYIFLIKNNYNLNIGCLIALIFFWRIVTYIILLIKSRRK
nr:ATP-binding cassette transporter Abcg-like2 [Brachionus angularis]